MFRLLLFLVGLLIGSWIARPAPPSPATPTRQPQTARPESVTPANGIAAHAYTAAPAAMQPAQPDALIDIKGIGPKFVEMLHAAGITTFEQLAAYDADSLAEKLGGRVTAERIRREQWIEQARERTRQRGTSLN